jgi:hypothetical protein
LNRVEHVLVATHRICKSIHVFLLKLIVAPGGKGGAGFAKKKSAHRTPAGTKAGTKGKKRWRDEEEEEEEEEDENEEDSGDDNRKGDNRKGGGGNVAAVHGKGSRKPEKADRMQVFI